MHIPESYPMTGYPFDAPCPLRWLLVSWSLMIDSSPSDTAPGVVPGAGSSPTELGLIANAYTIFVVTDVVKLRADFDAELVDEAPKVPRRARVVTMAPSRPARPDSPE